MIGLRSHLILFILTSAFLCALRQIEIQDLLLIFCKSLQEALGSKLRLSSAYHPQTDGQTERTIQSLEELLRACVLEHGGSPMQCQDVSGSFKIRARF